MTLKKICVWELNAPKFRNSTINDCTATRLFSKASCHRSPPHEPTTAPPIPCVPSSPGKLHNTAHATRRRRAPPSSMPTRPFRTNPARLILTPPRNIFHTPFQKNIFHTPHGTRNSPALSLSALAHLAVRASSPDHSATAKRARRHSRQPALHQTPGRKGRRQVGPAHHTAITSTGPLLPRLS